jgi:serine/threonine protein kinase
MHWLPACRDVKAENVVLEGGRAGGRVYLVDFGGVQAAAAADALSLGSTVIGTYGYMAPEQYAPLWISKSPPLV